MTGGDLGKPDPGGNSGYASLVSGVEVRQGLELLCPLTLGAAAIREWPSGADWLWRDHKPQDKGIITGRGPACRAYRYFVSKLSYEHPAA